MNVDKKKLFDNWPFMRGWEENHNSDRFTYVEIGPSVSVIPVRRSSRGLLKLTLIEEPRPELNNSLIIKAAGGFLRERSQEQAAHQIVEAETGLRCGRLHLFVPRMEGFSVLLMPIATYLGLDWTIVGAGSAKRITLSLGEAAELVLRQKIPDQCNADAILRLALLENLSRLPF